MELHQLRYFCSVARTGSFTKAAAQEGIAQPSLSEQISRLERSIGAKLFDRLGRGVQLTEAGRALLPEALTVLRQVNGVRAKLQALQQGVAGRLVVGCIPTITPYFLAPNLRDFTERFPEVELRLVEETTPVLLELLQTGELDLAVVSPPVNNPDVVCSEIFREPIVVAVSEKHRFARQSTVTLPSLTTEKLLLLKEGHCFRDNALTVCSRAKITFASMFETNQFSSILPLVSAGFGVSLVPQMAAEPGCGCAFLELEGDAFRRIGYMRLRQHGLGTAQRAFIGWLREFSADRFRKPPSG